MASRLVTEGSRDTPLRSDPVDGFVADVGTFIRSLGYEPVSGTNAGAFSVDFTIVDRRTGLFGIGIECDAPRHELLNSARAREIWRPSVLSRAIPRLCRIRSRQWYQNRLEEQQRLREAISQALDGGGTG